MTELGTHLRVISKASAMNTNMTGFRCFSEKSLHPCALDKSSPCFGRVKCSSIGRNQDLANNYKLFKKDLVMNITILFLNFTTQVSKCQHQYQQPTVSRSIHQYYETCEMYNSEMYDSFTHCEREIIWNMSAPLD